MHGDNQRGNEMLSFHLPRRQCGERVVFRVMLSLTTKTGVQGRLASRIELKKDAQATYRRQEGRFCHPIRQQSSPRATSEVSLTTVMLNIAWTTVDGEGSENLEEAKLSTA